jgi:hypothetical protein
MRLFRERLIVSAKGNKLCAYLSNGIFSIGEARKPVS